MFPRGWGTGEDEEAGAILKVCLGLGDFFFLSDGTDITLSSPCSRWCCRCFVRWQLKVGKESMVR